MRTIYKDRCLFYMRHDSITASTYRSKCHTIIPHSENCLSKMRVLFAVLFSGGEGTVTALLLMSVGLCQYLVLQNGLHLVVRVVCDISAKTFTSTTLLVIQTLVLLLYVPGMQMTYSTLYHWLNLNQFITQCHISLTVPRRLLIIYHGVYLFYCFVHVSCI